MFTCISGKKWKKSKRKLHIDEFLLSLHLCIGSVFVFLCLVISRFTHHGSNAPNCLEKRARSTKTFAHICTLTHALTPGKSTKKLLVSCRHIYMSAIVSRFVFSASPHTYRSLHFITPASSRQTKHILSSIMDAVDTGIKKTLIILLPSLLKVFLPKMESYDVIYQFSPGNLHQQSNC